MLINFIIIAKAINMFINLKSNLYYFLINSNKLIEQEYLRYSFGNKNSKKNSKLHSLLFVIYINIKYRILYNIGIIYILDKIVKNNRLYRKKNELKNYNRTPLNYLIKDVIKYDVISFDVFDTLILRPLENPTDMFYILEKQNNIPGFANIRIEAECISRKLCYDKYGHTEVTLENIYDIVEKKTGLIKKEGIKTELELEFRLCFANQYFKKIYDILLENNKILIAVSDMYLEKDFIENILSKNGFSFEKVFISCEYGCNKSNKKLYRIAEEYLKKHSAKNVIHFGDNMQSDIKNATKCGWSANYYRNCNEFGISRSLENMDVLVRSAYSSIVNTYLLNGYKTYSKYYQFGFKYIGIILLGFCKWLHNILEPEKLDKIYFVTGNGFLLRNAYKLMNSDKKNVNEDFFWSYNISILEEYLVNNDLLMIDLLEKILIHNNRITIRELFKFFGISSSVIEDNRYKIKTDSKLNSYNIVEINKVMIKYEDQINKHFRNIIKATNKYVDEHIRKYKNIAIIGFEDNSNGLSGLVKAIDSNLNCSTKINIYTMCKSNKQYEINDKINITNYKNQSFYNKAYKDKTIDRIMNNQECQFTMFSYDSLNDDYNFSFNINNLNKSDFLELIHEGALDFIREYLKRLGDYDCLFNISSNDSFEPYNKISKCHKYMKDFM